MPSNLPPITQNVLAGLQQMRSEQLSTLSKLLGLTIGNTVMALVEQVAPATPSNRDVLLAQTRQLLAQLQLKPATPAIKIQINNLLEQQQLLNSPLLKLVQLQINGRGLLTYTDKPVQAGQQLPIKLDAQQRLLQLQPLINTTTDAPESEFTPTQKPEQFLAKLETQKLLADALRTLLPHKETPQELLAALPKLQQLPLKQREQLLPPSVQQALKTLADQLRSPQQLTNPKLLPMVLKNSGVQFENKLAASLPVATAQHQPEKNILNTQANNRLINQDFKGALLHLLNRVTQEVAATPPQILAAATSANTANPATPPQSDALKNLLSPALFNIPQSIPGMLQLVQHIVARPQADLSDKVLHTQLLLLLHQHTLHSLAKIQLQQLHTINHQQAQVDNPQPTQSWVFEIPVRQGLDVHPLEIRIDQEWFDEERNSNDNRDKKTKQWTVMLSFDLPSLGGFYAQLTVIDDAVSAKLWAEHTATLTQAQEKLDGLRQQLQAQGVEVKQLQCVSGSPPSRSISLNYALVDITT